MVTAEELIREQHLRELAKNKIYKKVYDRIESKVINSSNMNLYECWYEIPEFLFNVPMYNKDGCKQFIKNKLKDYGQKIAFANIKRSEKTTEILNNFINLKIYNLKKNYIDKFVYFTKLYFIYFSKTEVTKKLPKIFLEFIFFTIVILIIIYMIFSNSLDNKTGILMVSTFGIAAYRLMPSVQQIFFSLSTIKN